MIEKLILKIISLLVETLASVIPNADQNIKAGTLESTDSSNPPIIVLTPGSFILSQQPGEATSNEPRPEEFREKLPVSKQESLGPYILTKTPLPGSIQCKVLFKEGKVTEKQVVLQEKQDFTIDYGKKQCSFTYDISEADSLFFIYSFVSIFTLRNFQQELFIDVQAASISKIEQLTSLIAGCILTYHDQLIQAYNQDPTYKTQYNAGGIGTVHYLNQIQLLEGKIISTTSPKTSLKFIVSGQLKATREITEGFGLIEKVRLLGI